ncbi:class I SAM-dependent DNA methyltransferase [Mesorhizobium sp. 113-3-3]|uniref:class I SAM-dependent DNA methyltransferase n=1 Tax=Mesorhizobium sp. 113-3-3 TaxID=2744516 RepID=UPI001FD497ED|nr:class I SAM-dependent methyltransferase [Mesorhizobium sp. 113-3-3]
MRMHEDKAGLVTSISNPRMEAFVMGDAGGDVVTRRSFEASAYSDYRSSHQTPGYGADYTKTYRSGYYAALWLRIERSLVENILRPLGGPGRSCLDFACGTGRVTTVAGPLFGEVVGVDVSKSMLACARVPGNVQLVEADLTVAPLSRSFDVVTAFRFFLNAEDTLRRDALAAIYEHLNDGGLLVSNIHMNATSPAGLVCRFVNRCRGRVVRSTMSIHTISSDARLQRVRRRTGHRLWFLAAPWVAATKALRNVGRAC